MKDTSKLITELSDNLKKTSYRSLKKDFSIWLIFTLIYTVGLFYFSGTYKKLPILLKSPLFYFDFILIILMTLFAVLSALTLARPANTKANRYLKITLGLSVFWAVAGFIKYFIFKQTGESFLNSIPGWGCTKELILLALLPSGFLVYLLKNNSPTRLALNMSLALLAAFGTSALSMHILCPVYQSTHVLFYHLAPVFIFSGFGVFAGKKILKW